MRLKVVVSIALTLLFVVVAMPNASGRAQINCDPEVGYGHFDPIAFFGLLPPTGHHHTFFGNQSLLTLINPNAATYGGLVGTATTCENADDSAAYWTPTLLFTATGNPVPVVNMHVYYMSFDNKENGEGTPLPADLRMIAGNHMATSAQSTKIVEWGCGNNTSRPGPYTSITKANCAAARGGAPQLTAVVKFPSCWDGQLNPHLIGNTADFSGGGGVTNHLAYHNSTGCPAGFPIKLTKLRMVVAYGYTGNGSNVRLSSDPVGGTPGRTMHADFWNTWVQPGMERMVAECVNAQTGPPEVCGF